MLAVQDSPAGRFLDGLGAQLPKPRAIVVASAHYESPQVRVGANVAPETVHDFGAFPPELFEIRYPAPGEPGLAQRVIDLLEQSGIDAKADPARGLDHGIWVPLRRMYPAADIPVIPLSVSTRGQARAQFDAGRALAPLRDEGVLVLGSGGFVHNLGELAWGDPAAAETPWSAQFAEWMRERLAANDVDALLDWERRAPQARRAHPTTEHLMPLFVALGAAGDNPALRVLHRSHEFGSLALDAFAFD
jgi:4,5-DOPA dioxygenase extradiol